MLLVQLPSAIDDRSSLPFGRVRGKRRLVVSFLLDALKK